MGRTSIHNVSLWFYSETCCLGTQADHCESSNDARPSIHCSRPRGDTAPCLGSPAPLTPAYLVSLRSYGRHPYAHAHIFTLDTHQRVTCSPICTDSHTYSMGNKLPFCSVLSPNTTPWHVNTDRVKAGGCLHEDSTSYKGPKALTAPTLQH